MKAWRARGSRLLVSVAWLLCCASPSVTREKERFHSHTGVIVEATEAPRLWHGTDFQGWYTHWYTIETESQLIKATEMVPPGPPWGRSLQKAKAPKPREPGRPEMSFSVGERVEFSIQQGPLEPGHPRELYVSDKEAEEHTLTINEILPKPTSAQD